MTVRVLVINSFNPLWGPAGNRQYLFQVCHAMRRAGAEIALYVARDYVKQTIPADADALFSDITFERSVRIGSTAYTSDPRVMLGRITRKIGRRLGHRPHQDEVTGLAPLSRRGMKLLVRHIRAHRPDIVLGNYFSVAEAFRFLDGQTRKLILLHDAMSARKDSYDQASLDAPYLADIVARENQCLAYADGLIAITPEEQDVIRITLPGKKAYYAPYSLDPVGGVDQREKEPVCIFVGSAADANLFALDRLFKSIWPKVTQVLPQARLRVVGRVGGYYTEEWPDGAVRVGPIDDLADEYARAKVAVAPLTAGSGMKIKVVEALAHGVPCVSTTVGVQGISGADPAVLAVTDDDDAFARQIVGFLQNQACEPLAESARQFVQDHYSFDSLVERMRQILEDGTPPDQ